MDVAANLARDGAPHGAFVMAEEQTRGRGRRGRSFYSPRGENLYVTFVLRPSSEMLRILPVAVPIAVCLACRSTGANARIKWPNDIWIDSEKTSGILIDAQAGPAGNVALPGIGINVNGDPTLQPELAGIATSLKRALGAAVDRELLLARLCNELEDALNWDADHRAGVYAELSMILGLDVSVQAGESLPWLGRAVSITSDGSLVVQRSTGETETVTAAEVTIRPAAR